MIATSKALFVLAALLVGSAVAYASHGHGGHSVKPPTFACKAR